MLTAVDIQNKKFHVGLGYDKKDVNTFMEEIVGDYAKLYRMYAELKEENQTLNDKITRYKAKESDLEKSILLAEKDSEDTKSKANREAKNIEMEAKNKAKTIIGDAEERLEFINNEVIRLETQYAAYKSNFCSLMKMQFEMMKENDFDMKSYIDDRALVLLGGSAPAPKQASGGDFGSFNGDPQMRDESSLGGMNNNVGGGGFGSGADPKNSTSAVYTASLGDADNFVDPFNPENNKRYNPFENTDVDNRNTKAITGKSSFKVNGMEDKKKFKRTPVSVAAANSQKEAAKASPKPNATKESAKSPRVEEPKDLGSTKPVAEKRMEETNATETTSSTNTSSAIIPDDVKAIVDSIVKETLSGSNTEKNSATNSSSSDSTSKSSNVDEIPTVSLDSLNRDSSEKTVVSENAAKTDKSNTSISDEEELVGDVETKTNATAMIGDGQTDSDDDTDTDEFGFKFV